MWRIFPTMDMLREITELPIALWLIVTRIILPELLNWHRMIFMAKKFVPETDVPALEGKVVLVTGGNAGLGKQTIAYLAAHSPARIYLGARTASKAASAIADIRAAVPDAPEIVHLPLDLTSFSSIADAANQFLAQESRLDILVNNAGVMATPFSTTKEGYELQFGTNHVGHALLTKLLLPVLEKTAAQPGTDVRIITVTSAGHYLAPSGGLVLSTAELEKQNTWRRYGISKLANILYARELAARHPAITSVSVHPGVIITDLYASVQANFVLKIGLWFYGFLAAVLPGHFRDTKGGALTQTWAASVPKAELVNGAYYTPVGVKHEGSKWARDEGLRKKLWEWTEEELKKHGY